MPQKTEIEKLKALVVKLEQKVSELKRSNVILSEETRILEKILDRLPGTFYIWDDTPTLIQRNKKHDEITRYSEEDYRDILPMDFFAKKNTPKLRLL